MALRAIVGGLVVVRSAHDDSRPESRVVEECAGAGADTWLSA